MKASQFCDYSIQLSAFTTGLSLHLGQLTGRLLSKFGETYSADPIVLPLPEVAPREIPRLTLKNADESEKIQISPARIDITSQRCGSHPKLDGNTIIKSALQVLKEYEDVTSATFGRLALIVIKTATLDNPAPSMAKHFCKSDFTDIKALSRPEVLEIHAYKRYKINETFPQINSWIRHRAGRHAFTNGEVFDGLVVELDINTAQEPQIVESANYTDDLRQAFFHTVPDEMSKIMQLYYVEA